MRRLGLTMTLLLCCAVTVGFASPSPSRVIYVVNDSTLVSQADLEAALPAFQAQVDQDLGPAWNVSAQLVIGQPGPSDWRITLTDFPACVACLGYHDWYQGHAEAEVGSQDWQITFSHELVEMLVDPYLRGDGQGGRFALAGSKLWLVEDADAVEDGSFAYERNGVQLSDFVLPAWYRPHSKGPWDFRGFVRRPGQILSGGYGWYMTAGRWVQV